MSKTEIAKTKDRRTVGAVSDERKYGEHNGVIPRKNAAVISLSKSGIKSREGNALPFTG